MQIPDNYDETTLFKCVKWAAISVAIFGEFSNIPSARIVGNKIF